MCEHNTEGGHCESCLTGFNAVQWSAGSTTDANACERKNEDSIIYMYTYHTYTSLLRRHCKSLSQCVIVHTIRTFSLSVWC